MTLKTRGAGRDGALVMLRALLVSASRLQSAGDRLSVGALARLLGVGRTEARELIDLLLGAGDIDIPCYLPLLETENGIELGEDPDFRCCELRFSHLETLALAAALDRVGLEPSNPSRKRIMSRFAFPDDKDVPYGETARPDLPDDTAVLMRCALAIVTDRSLGFAYRGTKDAAPRKRRVRPRELRQNGEFWTLEALDLDADGERTFFVSNMSVPELLAWVSPDDASGDANPERRVVTLRFDDPHLLDLLEWPDLEIVGESDGAIEARIPFYGGPWLVRRIASGGGSITTDDERLSALVKDYVTSLLDQR